MLRYLSGVTTLRLDREACVGCGLCAEVCPHAVFQVADDKACIVEPDACIECGACARNCPAKAIQVRAGVGCATGLIYSALGVKKGCCCSAPMAGAESGNPSCGCASETSD